MLEVLPPPEEFCDVASYLHFLDKKVQSFATRRCDAMTGDCECPDHVTWLVHLYRSPKKGLHGLHNPLFYESARLTSLNPGNQKLMSPCLPKLFPEFTPLLLCDRDPRLREISYPPFGPCGLRYRSTNPYILWGSARERYYRSDHTHTPQWTLYSSSFLAVTFSLIFSQHTQL